MVNSRRKGKTAELELSKVLGELLGTPFRRGVQYCGANGDADVVGLPGLHVECKRVQALNISKAMMQAMTDAKADDVPIVCHRKNGEQWLLTLCLDDVVELAQVIVATVNRAELLESANPPIASDPDTSPE